MLLALGVGAFGCADAKEGDYPFTTSAVGTTTDGTASGSEVESDGPGSTTSPDPDTSTSTTTTSTTSTTTDGTTEATESSESDTTVDPGPDPFVENQGADCEVPTIPGATNNNRLPDPFTKIDGTRITTKAEWRCRRQEILRTAEQHIYGAKPPKPDSVTGTVSNTSVAVNVSHGGQNTNFNVSIQLPTTGSAPYPALISLGGGIFGINGTYSNIVREEGVAVITYDPYAVGDENNGASRNNKRGAFYTIYGSNSSTGLLVAWSWGVSRIIDVIEESGGDIIDVEGIAVTGCSRFGKGAFTIGAFDQRIALTIPFESGSGGVPIWRGIPGEGAQSPSSAYGETYWLGDAFSSFQNNVNGLPVDTHEVVAMIAPRGLFVMDNPHIANLGPRSAHVAALAGAEVYEALGAGDNISYHSNVQEGAHCAWRNEWNDTLRQNLRKHLLKTGNDPGIITARANATGNLADWVDWETPTLE